MSRVKIDEDGLKALVDSELSNALGYVGKLSAQRQKALYYYFGEAKLELSPPEVDGRSSVVSTDTSDTIEWIMPSLLKTFAGGEDAVSFTPTREGEEDGADQATAFCNYVFYKQNPGFTILHNWFKDALLEKAGVVKTWWDTREDVKKEEYEALSEDELTILLQDKTVELTEARAFMDPDWKPAPMPTAQAMSMGMHPAMQPTPQQMPQASPMGGMQPPPGMQPPQMPQQAPQQAPMQPQGPPQMPGCPMLYDVTVARTKKSQQIRIENVPPEEFLISRRARTMDEPYFIAHRVQRSASDLIAMGYSQAEVDDCTSDDQWAEFNQEKVERLSFDDSWPTFTQQDEGGDPSRRTMWLSECYLNVDYDGDGIAELRRVVKCGTTILENDAVDDHPFSLVTPIMMPHRVIGLSIADIVMDIQRIKTVMQRQYLDSLNLATNPRLYVDTTQQVNLDDLLMVRPGGVIRGKGPNGVSPVVVPHTGQSALEGLQWMDDVRESRTGVSKHNNQANISVDKTATEVNALTNQANQRIELIARVFAETGVKDLFRKIFKLAQQNAQQPLMLRLSGKFVAVDPRSWKTQFDVSINVGLGTGNKDQQVQHLMMILQAQQAAAQSGSGVVKPENAYHALTELTKAVGFKDVGKFWTDPSQAPPPQPPPPFQIQVAQIKAQADQQIEQMRAQMKQQDAQVNAQIEMAKEQAKAQAQKEIEAAQMQADVATATQEAQLKAQLEAVRMQYDMQLNAIKNSQDQETQIRIAEIKAAAQVETARVSKQMSDGAALEQSLATEADL